MYSQGEIEEAVAAGALAPEQAASLRAFVATRNGTATADEEYLTVFRGYNDLFTFYACFLALVAAGWLGSLLPLGSSGPGLGPVPALPFMAPLLVVAAAWGLAEFFTLRRRAALASLLLAFAFGFGVLLTLAFILMPIADGPIGASILIAVSAGIAAAASWAFWLRFRVALAPMLAVGCGIIALVGLLMSLLMTSPAALDVMNVVLLLCGFAVFAYAMFLDGSDPWRVSDRNEVGLWMHLLASILIVYPIVYFMGLTGGVATIGGAIAMILLYLAMTVLALAVNRKVYLLAALSPLIVALNRLLYGQPRGYYDPDTVYGSGFGGAYGGNPYGSTYGGMRRNPITPELVNGTFTTILIVSLILLALAIWWAPLRRLVSGLLPEGVRARAPLVVPAPYAEVPPPPAPPMTPPPQPPIV